MTINLKLLSVFVLVAEYRSFRRAGEEIGRSQSAVSLQIRQLEEQLGVTLFHRTTRKVALSTEGERLLAFARQSLEDINRGVQSIVDDARLGSKSVSIACTPTVAGARLAAILSAFRQDFPDVTVHVQELAAAEMLDSIQAQDVEFGIGPRVKRETEFHFRPIMHDEILAVMPPGEAIANAASITLNELSRQRLIMILKSAALRADLERAMAEQHVAFSPQYEGMHVQTVLSLIEAGLGAGILPRIAIPANSNGRFVVLPLSPPMTRELCIVTLAGKTLSPLTATFVEVAVAILQAGGIPAAAS